MRVEWQHFIGPGLAGLVFVAVAIPLRFRWGPLERVEAQTYDWRVRWAARVPPPAVTNLGFVDINDESIRLLKSGTIDPRFRFGLYWPRHLYGRVLRELHAQGARAVALDVLFAEPRDDHAPVKLPAEEAAPADAFWQGLPEPLRPTLFRDQDREMALVESDAFFAWQLHRTGIGILAADRGVFPYSLLATNAAGIGDISAEKDLDGVLRRARAFQIYRVWHPLFQKAAEEFGVDLQQARIEADRILLKLPDGTELPPIFLDREGRFALSDLVGDTLPAGWPDRARPFEERRVWHMGVVLAARALQLDLETAEVDLKAGRIELRGPGVTRVIPVDEQGFFLIDWTIQPNQPGLVARNFVEVLAQDLAREAGAPQGQPGLWKDRLVVIGSTATGNDLTDLGATPLARETFLLSKHWNVAHSILTGRFVRRTGFGTDLSILAAMVAAAAGMTLLGRPPWSPLGVFAAGLLYTAAATWAYQQHRLWLPLVAPVLGGLGGTHGVLLAYQALFEQREKRRVKSVFSRIVSPDVVQELLRARELSLGGQRREVTVFFADIRGFTELTDRVQAEAEALVRERGWSGPEAEACYAECARETLRTVNEYLACVADVIKRHQGTLDKYIGDCVMAFWGAPTPRKDHAAACVRAAIDAQRIVRALNARRAAENRIRGIENERRRQTGLPPRPQLPLLQLGTGIHTGVVTVGLMGSDQHLLNYTVFGREVNLASRLENISGQGRILISQVTYEHLLRSDPALTGLCRPLPPVTVKGIRDPIAVYEVMWQDGADETGPSGRAGFAPQGDSSVGP